MVRGERFRKSLTGTYPELFYEIEREENLEPVAEIEAAHEHCIERDVRGFPAKGLAGNTRTNY